MLRARVLPEVLSQIVGDGIEAAMCVSLNEPPLSIRRVCAHTPSLSAMAGS